MIQVIFCRINATTKEEFSQYLKEIPFFMQREILMLKFYEDQLRSLIPKLILIRLLREQGKEELINKWKKDSYNKPYIEGWDYFSISHSAEIVVFVYAKSRVGIDVEHQVSISESDIIEYLHPAERAYISISENFREHFFQIWTKKESALKAIGHGLINGLNQFSCLEDRINWQNITWHFTEITLEHDYKCHLCCEVETPMISLKQFDLKSLTK